jgi:hypothetical protein
MIEKLGRADFAEHLNTTFRAEAGPSEVFELELTDVKGIDEGETGSKQERFSLMFSGPADRFYPQGTYQLEHERIGKFNLFIVPIGKASDGRLLYEAAFNRLRAEGS